MRCIERSMGRALECESACMDCTVCQSTHSEESRRREGIGMERVKIPVGDSNDCRLGDGVGVSAMAEDGRLRAVRCEIRRDDRGGRIVLRLHTNGGQGQQRSSEFHHFE